MNIQTHIKEDISTEEIDEARKMLYKLFALKKDEKLFDQIIEVTERDNICEIPISGDLDVETEQLLKLEKVRLEFTIKYLESIKERIGWIIDDIKNQTLIVYECEYQDIAKLIENLKNKLNRIKELIDPTFNKGEKISLTLKNDSDPEIVPSIPQYESLKESGEYNPKKRELVKQALDELEFLIPSLDLSSFPDSTILEIRNYIKTIQPYDNKKIVEEIKNKLIEIIPNKEEIALHIKSLFEKFNKDENFNNLEIFKLTKQIFKTLRFYICELYHHFILELLDKEGALKRIASCEENCDDIISGLEILAIIKINKILKADKIPFTLIDVLNSISSLFYFHVDLKLLLNQNQLSLYDFIEKDKIVKMEAIIKYLTENSSKVESGLTFDKNFFEYFETYFKTYKDIIQDAANKNPLFADLIEQEYTPKQYDIRYALLELQLLFDDWNSPFLIYTKRKSQDLYKYLVINSIICELLEIDKPENSICLLSRPEAIQFLKKYFSLTDGERDKFKESALNIDQSKQNIVANFFIVLEGYL
ncbi:hypothetical protein ACFL21_03365 [Patescibacteria group bacterium]